MQETIEKRGGERRVVVEDLCPFFERTVGSQDDGAALIALGDDLEEQVRTDLVDREVSNFIDLRYAQRKSIHVAKSVMCSL
jgi:hypothetical protein